MRKYRLNPPGFELTTTDQVNDEGLVWPDGAIENVLH